jgi:hypothetical protein
MVLMEGGTRFISVRFRHQPLNNSLLLVSLMALRYNQEKALHGGLQLIRT